MQPIPDLPGHWQEERTLTKQRTMQSKGHFLSEYGTQFVFLLLLHYPPTLA